MLIKGKVEKGAKRGQKLGFPTANILLTQKMPEGIYLSQTLYQGKVYPSLTFIGKARTFEDSVYQSETYILDTNLNLYGKTIKVEIIKKIRKNQKFKTPEELVLAMKQDEKLAKEYF